MKILVIGSGGREHAIAWRLAQCPSVSRVFATPGNPGIAQVAEIINTSDQHPETLRDAALAAGITLTVVGPEAPLAAGVVDVFRAAGLPVVGPTQAAAQLESSKVFAKQFMHRHALPTAGYAMATSYEEACAAFDRFGTPVVLKADGLAAGKGVVIAQNRAEAEAAAKSLLGGELVGAAGSRLVVEEFLVGEEVSFIGLCDGESVLPLAPTQDHKAAYDGDTGPNTGGMGAYCDSRILTSIETERVMESIMLPSLAGMKAEGTPFSGFLYAGLMMTEAGPKILEFNVRLGDPETQALMHRIESDFAETLAAAARGSLRGAQLAWKSDPSVCVVMSAHGYPGKVRSGDAITGISEAEATGATVFQAGTKMVDGQLVTSGGRVLGVTASASTLQSAIAAAYQATAHVKFDGMHFRNDIGRKGLKRW